MKRNLLFLTIIFTLVFINCSKDATSPEYDIVYKVETKCCKASITYIDENGIIQQDEVFGGISPTYSTTWYYDFSAKSSEFIQLSADIVNYVGSSYLELTVTILKDGEIWQEASCDDVGCTVTVGGTL